jgi:hypothetical protein
MMWFCKPNKFAGGSPAAGHFLLCGQKKVTKEYAAPAHRPCGLLCAARRAGRLPPKVTSFGARNSPSQIARGLRQSSPTTPEPAVLLGGSHGNTNQLACHGQKLLFDVRRKPTLLRLIPCAPPSSGVAPGDVGEHCASARNCLEEMRMPALTVCNRGAGARVAQPPGATSSTGEPAGPANWGRLLLVTFLGKTRKVTSCRAAPGDFSWFKTRRTARSRHATTC